jgi:hypothetical protein
MAKSFFQISVARDPARELLPALLRRRLRIARLLGRRRREEDEHVGDDDGRDQEIEGGEQPVAVRNRAADERADART